MDKEINTIRRRSAPISINGKPIVYAIDLINDSPMVPIDLEYERRQAAKKWMSDMKGSGTEGTRQIKDEFKNYYRGRDEEGQDE